MENVDEVLAVLEEAGNAQTRNTYARHGAPANMFGVKIGDMKKIAKSIKGNQDLALQLFDTGNADAQYLAGMVANGALMTKKQLDGWARKASWHMVSEYTVPWVATESSHGRSLALKWMAARKEQVVCSGWTTYAGLVAVLPDEELDLGEIQDLLEEVASTIHEEPNRVRYTMNGLVISVGTYVKPLQASAKGAAKYVGKVSVDMGDTACKVPLASEHIAKVESMGRIGKKRKTLRC